MKLTLRARALGKKFTLITTAYVLAVSSLTASVPFILSSQASALAVGAAEVRNEAELVMAASDVTIKTVSVKQSFTVSQKIVFSGRNVYIDGNANTVTFNGDAPGWTGNYVIQAYKIALGVKNLSIRGGDAAIYANGSTLNLEGKVDVTGNEFGGIEVSKGSGVTTAAQLNVGTANLVNNSEQTTKPTAWIDQASTVSAVVNGPFTETTHIGVDQKQYYLRSENAGIIATSHGETYGSLQEAINDSDTVLSTPIVVNKSHFVTSQVTINKPVVVDGNGYTVSGSFVKTDNANNSVIGIQSSGVTVKNLTVDAVSNANYLHGINIYQSNNVALEQIVAKNGNSGVNVNGSQVTINGIRTSGNAWHGVDVDKGAVLTIKGVNTHTEAKPLYVDMVGLGQINDVDNRYDVVVDEDNANARIYVLDVTGPTISWQVQPDALVKDSFKIRPITNEEGMSKAVYIDVIDENHLCRELTSQHKNFDVSNANCPELFASLSNGTHKFIAVFTDQSGNATVSESKVFEIDRQGPTITLQNSSIGSDGFYSKVGYNFYDKNKVDYITINGVKKDLTNSTYSNIDNIGSPNWYGAHEGTNELIAYDVLGNSSSISFTIDRTAPASITFKHSNNNDTKLVNSPVTSTLIASEPIQTPDGWTPVEGGNGKEFTKISTANNKGNVTVTDLAGNSKTVFFEVKRIDTTSPTFNIASGANLNTSTVEVIATEENLETITVDGNVVTYAGSKPDYKVTVTGEGAHYVIATDKAGNSTRVDFTIDTIAPSVEGDTYTRVNNVITPALTTNDPTAVITWELITGQEEGVEVSSLSTLTPDFTVLIDGTYTYRVTARDAAGNSTSRTFSFTYVTPSTEPVTTVPGTTPSDEEQGSADEEVVPFAQTPSIVGPTGFAAVLGLGDSNTDTESASVDETAEVQGISTANTLAAALDNTNGKAFGLAWYWWLLIVAAVAGAAWWIAAAVRRRQAE